MKTRANESYYLHWRNNPCTWNENLADLIQRNRVRKVKGRYYTVVVAHYSGSFGIVDCTCDTRSGDFHSINTSLLKEI